MKDRYNSAIEQAKSAETPKEQRRCILTIVETMATNHLPCIENKIKNIKKWLLVGLFALLLAILFQDQLSLTHILSLIKIL